MIFLLDTPSIADDVYLSYFLKFFHSKAVNIIEKVVPKMFKAKGDRNESLSVIFFSVLETPFICPKILNHVKLGLWYFY